MYKLKLVSTLIIMSLAILGCEKDPILYDVSLSQSIGGNVLVSQIGTLEKGTIIEFSAEASQNYQFVEWVNSINGKTYTQNPLNLTIDNDVVMVPLFRKIELNLNINTIGNGTVEAVKVSSAKNSSLDDMTFESGDIVDLRTIPDEGNVFMNWNEALEDTVSVKQITISENQNITANFNYELAKKLVGTWDIVLAREEASSSRFYSRMRVSVDYGMNCYFQSWNSTGQRTTYKSKVKFWSNGSCSLGNLIYINNINFTNTSSFGCSLNTTNDVQINSEEDIEVNQTIIVNLDKAEDSEVLYDDNGLISEEQPVLEEDIVVEDIASALSEIVSITIGLPTTSIDDLTGKWNVKELYYLNLENDITATFQIPECAREFSYHTFTSDGSITNQGIGINWPLNKCTSDPFNINNSQITISSNGNQIVHYINNIKRTWVILDKPDEDTLILESFRNDASDNYNGNDVGFKLVRDIPNVTIEELVGNWNIKELYYLNLENDITATFQIPECAREFSYHTFTSDGSITNQGIGINWPLNKCTSDPFNINNSQITISSNGNQIVHYINNIKRTWVILDKPDEDTLILESFRNDASDNYNGNDVGFKLVKENRFDETPPTMSLIGNSSIQLTIGDTYLEQGATANDNIDGNITSSIIISGSVNTSAVGNYTLTYTVSDNQGNTTSVSRLINVTVPIDETPPTMSLIGNSSIQLTIGDTYLEQGATANDNIDGNITSSIIISGSVNTSAVGTYSLSYSVSDAAGNVSSVIRIINVSVPSSLTDNYLNGTWDGIELYLYSSGTANIENTYDVPTCGEPYTYLIINKTTSKISTQGIGINYPNGNCTSSEYPVKSDSYTINSDGNSFEHDVGGTGVIRKYEIVSKTENEMIVKSYRNGSEEVSYGKPTGFKWVRRN